MNKNMKTTLPETDKVSGFLGAIEKAGNKLPHPFFLFFYLLIFTIILSAALNYFGVHSMNPKTGEAVLVKSLASGEGIVHIFTSLVGNFVNFPVLGTIIVVMFGVGVADQVGLISIVMKQTVTKAPRHLLTFLVFVTGVSSSIASDASFLIFIPLVAMIFQSVGRHPIAGAAAAYAAVGAGYDASFFVTAGDAIFSGIATEAARIIDPNAYVSPVDNYYFAACSVILLAIVGTIIVDRIVEPRLNRTLPLSVLTINPKAKAALETEISAEEKRGLKQAGLFTLAFVGLIAFILLPTDSPFRNAEGGLIPSPFMKSFVPFLFIYFLGVGYIYGKATGVIKKAEDIPEIMSECVKNLASILVLFFMISQFIALFKWSGIGSLVAFEGATFLSSLGLTGYSLIVAFILLTALMNIFMTSGSAQFALFAPIFIPMLMQLNIEPAFTMAMFRVGDSTTNIISPLSPYFAVVLAFMQQYYPKLKLGTLMATMLPLAFGFLVTWTLFMLLWTMLGFPVGPGVYMHM
ncbi:AbgT family transporter [Pseudomonas sp.]|uniref:AbgT family transporter n=1 Tax=Pseudomonas sp. TaxID=306 RepID=UPI003A98334A